MLLRETLRLTPQGDGGSVILSEAKNLCEGDVSSVILSEAKNLCEGDVSSVILSVAKNPLAIEGDPSAKASG